MELNQKWTYPKWASSIEILVVLCNPLDPCEEAMTETNMIMVKIRIRRTAYLTLFARGRPHVEILRSILRLHQFDIKVQANHNSSSSFLFGINQENATENRPKNRQARHSSAKAGESSATGKRFQLVATRS
jgi:hypothetical protein